MVLLLFILGACLGSFYLVIGKRLPKNENVITGRSRCDHCGKELSWWHLFPVLSYLFLRGKCYYCHKKISPLNLIVELTCGFIFAFSYAYYGVGYEMYMLMIISSLMILIFISDFSYYIILDSPLVIGSILIAICKCYYLGVNSLTASLLSAVGLFLSMYAIKLFGDVLFKRESLGGGDIKFAFVIGMILGFRLGLCALILSTFLALPYSVASLMLKKNNEVPYGPFLASSLFIVFIFSEKFISLLNLIFISL